MSAARAFSNRKRPSTVAVGGFESEVGKTTLVCDLLRAFQGWEAIKLTRGHYRSCGRDPQMCCVGHLLRSEPVVCSGRESNHHPGKDTGRFWEAGAANVHWVIATDDQVEEGMRIALERVRSQGVIIEGNSFLRFVDVDFAVMVARAEGGKVKPTARRVLGKADALFLSGNLDGVAAREQFASWCRKGGGGEQIPEIPIYARDELPLLVAKMQAKLQA